MTQQRHDRVPFDDANRLFVAFGIEARAEVAKINPRRRDYLEDVAAMSGVGPPVLRRDDGFDLEEVDAILDFAPRVLSFRYLCFEVTVDRLGEQLVDLGLRPSMTFGRKGRPRTIRIGGRTAEIEDGPDARIDAVPLIAAVNGLIAGRASYRPIRPSNGADRGRYGVQTVQGWRDLEAAIPETLGRVFHSPDAPPAVHAKTRPGGWLRRLWRG